MNRLDMLHDMLHSIAQLITDRAGTTSFRVAIDGIDAAEKSTLADELADVLRSQGRTVIRASIDGFHNPSSIRYRQGELSPLGYYEDSFNYDAIRELLLDPLSPGGSLEYQVRIFDFESDSAVTPDIQHASPTGILIFDGVFLQRPELVDYWDLVVFVDIPFEMSLERALVRDLPLFGNPGVIREKYLKRYIPGQQIYFEQCAPKENADIGIDNRNPDQPLILRQT